MSHPCRTDFAGRHCKSRRMIPATGLAHASVRSGRTPPRPDRSNQPLAAILTEREPRHASAGGLLIGVKKSPDENCPSGQEHGGILRSPKQGTQKLIWL